MLANDIQILRFISYRDSAREWKLGYKSLKTKLRTIYTIELERVLNGLPRWRFALSECYRLDDVSGVQTIAEWETVYLIASVVHFLGVAFYAVFASGEKQPWAEPSDDDDEEEVEDAAADGKPSPPVNKSWTYGTAAGDAGAGLYQTSLEMVQHPGDQADVTYSNGSAYEHEQRR